MKNLKLIILISLVNFSLLFGAVWYADNKASGLNQASNLSAGLQTGQQNNPADLNQQPLSKPDAVAAPAVKPKSFPPTNPPAQSQPPIQQPATTPVVDNRCLVMIQGKKYDVTEFRRSHPGGNIFQCGTDMTEEFLSQHGGQNMAAQLAPLLVN